jgi:hypothetical protein
MGYDLKPRNKIEGFHMGAFSWGWMLNAGVGLAIGTGNAIEPASYSYIPDKRGRSPQSNDGYYVSAKKAKLMSTIARGLVQVESFKNNEWDKLSPEKQKQMQEWNDKFKIYNMPVRKDFIEKTEDFAEWAEKSGGFWIY